MLTGTARVNRLRWLCRRGMKELDLILEGFLEREEGALAAGDWPTFEALLETEDDVLWDWFQGRNSTPPDHFMPLVDAIRG